MIALGLAGALSIGSLGAYQAVALPINAATMKAAVPSDITDVRGGARVGGVRAGGYRAGGVRAGGYRAAGVRAGGYRGGVPSAIVVVPLPTVVAPMATAAVPMATVPGARRQQGPRSGLRPLARRPRTITATNAATIPIRRATSLTKRASPIKLTALSGSRLNPPAPPGDLTFPTTSGSLFTQSRQVLPERGRRRSGGTGS
jgi:hypothetical protein